MEQESIAVSVFKATCLEQLRRVKQTGQPLLVTRRGEPIAMVVPPPRTTKDESWLGCLRGTASIKGDLIEPAVDPDDWEVLAP